MKILALESADGAASLAYADGQQHILLSNQHMRDSLSWFMQQVESLREQHFGALSQLDCLACCTGPGGFTGVRVAVGYMQGLGLAAGLPCIGVSSLDALAAGQAAGLTEQEGQEVYLALDARMQELYLARYWLRDGRLQRDEELSLVSVEQAREQIASNAILAGSGFDAWPDLFQQQTRSGIRLDAAGVLAAAQAIGKQAAVEAAQLQPIYLRNQVAKTLAERGLA